MKLIISAFMMFFVFSSYCAQKNLPIVLAPVIIGGDSNCPNSNSQAKNDTISAIQSILRDTVVPLLNERPPCSCGGPGGWTRIAHLNMSDPSYQCPSNWSLITTPVRACGRSTQGSACDSAYFSSGGRSYSRVCGRINAYQKGTPSAFEPRNPGALEGVYIDGVSLTHGANGSRQHIWTFAAAHAETGSFIQTYPSSACPCASPNNWPYTVPEFIGHNYFCDTGNPGPFGSLTAVYSNNPLWDGEGCGPTSTCCQLNNPPWFCTTLPQPTTDDLEVRICHDEDAATNEDTIISLIDIYYM